MNTAPLNEQANLGTSVLGATRVLLVTESLQVGGAERQALQVIQRLPRDDFAVELALLGSGGPLQEEAHSMGLRVHVIPRQGILHHYTIRRLAHLLREGRFDVAEGLLHYSSLMVGLCGLMARIPVRISSNVGDRSLYARDLAARKQRWVKKLSYVLCNRIFVNSRFMAEADPQLQAHRHKVHCIHNGLREESFETPLSRDEARAQLDLPVSAPVACMMGRLVPAKDYETFLQVISALRKGHDSLHGIIIGDGPHRPALETLRDSLGLTDRVRFTGTLRDPRAALGASDIFVFCSRRESLPNAVLEAMAQGLPVVAARTAGVPELIDEGAYGFLCKAGVVDDFVAHVGELLEDPARRKEWGAAARFAARRRFHWDVRIRDYIRLLSP